MMRFRPRLFKKILTLQSPNRRYLSSKSSSSTKFALLFATGVVSATGAALIYAKNDKKFADQLYSYAPFLKSILEEDKSVSISNDELKPLKKKIVKPVEAHIKQKNLEPEKKREEPPIVEKKEPTILPVQPVEETAASTTTVPKFDFKKDIEKSVKEKAGFRDVEDEFREQLKRLLHAFNEFYEEKRILYETEIKRAQEIEMKNLLIQERGAVAQEYEKAFKKLKQMEQLLEIRDQLDKQEKASKKLWLTSQVLSKILEHDKNLSIEAKRIQINEKIECIRKIVKENFANESLLLAALESLPEDAVKNGIYSEDELVRRFHNIEKTCSRVALVTDQYTDILGYIKSYLYSCIHPILKIGFELSSDPVKMKKITEEELQGKVEIDPSELDIFDILERVSLCVECRNLEMAIRYANLLSGEPRNVAQSWINDAREHLEVKQVIDLVQAKIASINLHQLSFSV